MSRLYKINRKYLIFRKYDDNFILNIFLKKFIKDGNYFKAKNILIKMLNFIKEKEKKNSYLIFLLAIYNVSPRIHIVTRLNPKNNKIIYKKELLPFIKSIRLGMNLILSNYKKNKGDSTYTKLATEIIQSFYKRSFSVKRKYEIEKLILKKTANDFGRKNKLNLFLN